MGVLPSKALSSVLRCKRAPVSVMGSSMPALNLELPAYAHPSTGRSARSAWGHPPLLLSSSRGALPSKPLDFTVICGHCMLPSVGPYGVLYAGLRSGLHRQGIPPAQQRAKRSSGRNLLRGSSGVMQCKSSHICCTERTYLIMAAPAVPWASCRVHIGTAPIFGKKCATIHWACLHAIYHQAVLHTS